MKRILAGALAAAVTLALPGGRPEAAAPAETSEPAAEAPSPAAEAAQAEPQAAPGGAEAATFEVLVRGAEPVADLGTLLGPFTGKCESEKREVDRIRCRSTRSYLRKVIPRRSFWAVVSDPAAIVVSEYDASIKGYHLSIAGCLSCTRPVAVGRTKEQRLITVKAPAKEKEAESLRAAVEVSRNSVGFDSLKEAKTWLEQSRPELRTQFVFQPGDTDWTFGSNRGYAMKLLGWRVFNRCTGEILVSRPPSTRMAEIPGAQQDEGCRRAKDAAEGGEAQTEATLPANLSKNDISHAMNAIRPQVYACFQKFKVPGLAQFDFVVAGNGTVNSVRLSGAFFGTPTGTCLLDVAKNAHFSRFARERQQFVYPFFLRQ